MIKEVIRYNLSRLMIYQGFVKADGTPHQKALERATGVDQKTIGNYLREDWSGSPNVETLERLCPALQVSMWQLLMPNLPVGLPALRPLHGGLDAQMLGLCATMSRLPDDARRQLAELAEFHESKQAASTPAGIS